MNNMEYIRDNLTKAMRWEIAEQLAKDRLEDINKNLDEVKVNNTFYTRYGKRVLDIILSLAAIVITLPINLVILIITFFDVGNPVFFKQQRVGKNGKIFTIVKFRNMRNITDDSGELLPAEQRVTKWGKFARKTSLDELLNFYNIFKGDMSIIGPRPLPTEYLIRYNKQHIMRLAVRPGLECPPKEFKEDIWTWQEHLDNDVWYVENVSLLVDIMESIRLIRMVFNRKSAEKRAAVQVGTFMGYNLNGEAITLEDIPQEYVEQEFRRVKGMKYYDE